jgi:transcriptional regulator with XRE-family HTH domain
MLEFDRIEFARVVQSRMAKKGWTESILAEKANISQSQVSRILNAKLKRFNLSHAYLCKLLRIRSDRFLGQRTKSEALCNTIDRICGGRSERATALATILDNVLRLTERE